jgi:acetyltransferase-like isoleucine patch superfamily enzyme
MSVFIHPSAEVHSDSEIGDGTKIWNNVQIREKTKIGFHCNIGKGVYIDSCVKIGNYVKIQNYASIYYGVEVEDEVFIGPNATFTNDLYPRATSTDWKVIPTKLKFGCSIGANATIICGVTIGSFSMIGAGSVVTSNCPPYSLMIGNPARIAGFVCKKGHLIKQVLFGDEIIYNCNICNQKLILSFRVEEN